ncbi:MAG TPA: helix-hairpin-helix domain-containing protein [Spirochaetia bacterium]|nr:helix-hairpin-helix domain-containing protein [Spirochaetia bacterium]
MISKTLKNIYKKTNGLDRFLIIVSLIGVGVAVVSLFRGILMDRRIQVEYLNGENMVMGEAETLIFVDIEGAVIKSGVFELKDGSRVKDVLVMAGGLSDGADRDFCEKNINMAELVKDGQKIYIPFLENTNAPYGYTEANVSSKRVNINSASISELDTLWGIGSARAESIVKNRPYQSIEDLITKNVLTKSLVDKNREMMSVY